MFHESCDAFLPLLLSRQVFTLPTAVTYPEREGSDKLGSAVIGRLKDDTAERRRGRRTGGEAAPY